MAATDFTPDPKTLFLSWYGLKETGEILNNIIFTLGAVERLAGHEEKISHDELAAVLSLIDTHMDTVIGHCRRAEDFLDQLHKACCPETSETPSTPTTFIH